MDVDGHTSPHGSRSGRFIDILIVEDRPVARGLLVSEIESAEDLRICGEARDGVQAVEMVRTLSPDVVVMDIVMPRMDGLEATGQIRTFSKVPIIILTGSKNSDETLRLMAKKRGADSFFVKPSGPVSADLYKIRDELIHEIRRLATR